MFKKLLLATDGSEYALRAAEKTVEMAKNMPEVTIHIVYVVDNSKTEVLNNWNTMGAQEKRKEKIKPTEEKFKEAHIDYKVEFLRGEPGPSIVKHANENNFDMVIVGSRGRNRLQELVLGSVSHKVAKRVECAVMIIK
ncbi:universal stress protein [Texcoconibacillus texcoconensis]|uniref:Nucleotide-binding universal stress UspA family protein n=1 Tax=Texcoconibacillus texcoconensis TaxID=1095777 RepID=A0A840QPU0_9BACI|nr:universal stress protein [Texcoconibacillus texcoconensis]MBB5173351.1 nucleotide-binding universal stress UspA family protein [Texcoconibacillus texcoconensis]